MLSDFVACVEDVYPLTIFSVDGLRVDTAQHVDTAFWSGFDSAAGVFMTGEWYQADAPTVCAGQDLMDSVLDYPG